MEIFSENLEETQAIAFFLFDFIQKIPPGLLKKALVISLEGQLGSGKTEFLKGIAKRARIKEKVLSPTFLLMKSFKLTKGPFTKLWHLDCYRLNTEREFRDLGIEEIFDDNRNLIFIEWGDKVKKILPSDCWRMKFIVRGEQKRLLKIIIPQFILSYQYSNGSRKVCHY